MNGVTAALRADVTRRAANRCEYCGLSQERQEATFHVDHVTPRAVGGATVLENLSLACVSCSLRKGARQYAYEPQSGVRAPIFNPRTQVWTDHFRFQGVRIIGVTACGRATIEALAKRMLLFLVIPARGA